MVQLCGCQAPPPQSTSTHTALSVFLYLSVSHTHTHSWSHKQEPPRPTTKAAYLPPVPALFCQVTSFLSFLLSVSLTLSPTPPSLSLCFSLTLTLLSVLLSLSLLWWTSLPIGFVPWLLSLWRSPWFVLSLSLARDQRFNLKSFLRAVASFVCANCVTLLYCFYFQSMCVFEKKFKMNLVWPSKDAQICLPTSLYAQICVSILKCF